MHYSIFEIALVNHLIAESKNTLPTQLPFYKLSSVLNNLNSIDLPVVLVLLSITLQHSLTMHLSINPLTLIFSTIIPSHFSIPVKLIIYKSSFVNSILVYLTTFPLPQTLFKITHVLVASVLPCVDSVSREKIIFKCA
jgi:cytochrome c oxidase subunit IV